jgi:hypothetical protein
MVHKVLKEFQDNGAFKVYLEQQEQQAELVHKAYQE